MSESSGEPDSFLTAFLTLRLIAPRVLRNLKGPDKGT